MDKVAEGVCQKCGNDNALTTPCKHKEKPKVFKFVEGVGLVETDPDAVTPLNHDEVRRALRSMRTQRKKRQHQEPKKRPKPHAKKWNRAARRHLDRYVEAMERRAKALQEIHQQLMAVQDAEHLKQKEAEEKVA